MVQEPLTVVSNVPAGLGGRDEQYDYETMPVDPDIRLADGDHVVQFYECDDDLVRLVVGYLAAAVRDGDAVVVVARPDHRAAFLAGLDAAGVDTAEAEADGRLTILDAHETLARFMTGDGLDAAAFDTVVGGTVRAASAGGRPVRAYGEMVALLWAAGDVAGAIELERLWNELGEALPFSLFCAYPTEMVADPHAADAFAEVCHLHSDVLAGAPSPAAADASRRFARSWDAPRLARQFVADTLCEWGLGHLVDDCTLVVTELATNAVSHAGSDVTVSLSHRGDVVRLEVGDASAAPPSMRERDLDAPGGRGLQLVSVIAGDWGHVPTGGGKLVWADVGVDPQGAAG